MLDNHSTPSCGKILNLLLLLLLLRLEFIKENMKVRKQENTLSTRKAIKKKRKHALVKESDKEKKEKNDNGQKKRKENTLSTKKAIKEKRKKLSFLINNFLGRFLGGERVFYLFSYFLVFF